MTPGGTILRAVAAIILVMLGASSARAASAGTEFKVNTTTAEAQITPAAAMDADGDFVVVWSSAMHPDDLLSFGIYGQRYNNAGVAQGSEFRVNTFTTGDQTSPAVAMDADGDFVVAWVDGGQDGDGSGIYAQRFNAAGVPQGGEFRVNTQTAGVQHRPAIAIESNGDFVIAWAGNGPGEAPDGGIFARRYDASGSPLGSDFLVNTTTAGTQTSPAAAMDADGDFVIVWTSQGQDGSGDGVYAQRFDASGAAQGGEFRVNVATQSNQSDPSAGMSAAGDIVISWQSQSQDGSGFGVYVRRYSAAGVAQGGEILVNSNTSGDQKEPAVAVDASGDFLIAWTDGAQDGSGSGIYARRYFASGVEQGTVGPVNGTATGDQRTAAVAIDASGRAVIAWAGNGPGDPDGIFAMRPNAGAADLSGPRVAGVFFGDGVPIPVGSTLPPANISTLRINFSRPMGASAASTANYGLTRTGVAIALTSIMVEFDVASGTDHATLTFAQPLDVAGNYILTLRDSIRDAAGLALDGNTSGSPGGTLRFPFSLGVAQLGTESRINLTTTGNQTTLDAHAIAFGANSSRPVWSDGDDVYTGTGSAPDARVNVTTANVQSRPAIAGDGNGTFTIVWESAGGQDGDQGGIYSRRVNNSGFVSGEVRVNSTTAGNQTRPSIAANVSGSYVVVWVSNGIFAQRYNSNGSVNGGEFQVSTSLNTHTTPRVAIDAAGNFVVAWATSAEDGSGFGIFARRFDAAGVAQGGVFQVNTFTTGDQSLPDVAMNPTGDFVIAWQSMDQDGDLAGIYAQRFSADGAPRGSEFRVNTTTTGNQATPAVAMNDRSLFIAWSGPGVQSDIFGQHYTAAGTPSGAEFVVNSATTLNQTSPSVAMNALGRIVVAWTGTQSGDADIYTRGLSEKVPPTFLALRAYGQDVPPDSRVEPGGTQLDFLFSETFQLIIPNVTLSRDGVDLGTPMFGSQTTTDLPEGFLLTWTLNQPLAPGVHIAGAPFIFDVVLNIIDGDGDGLPDSSGGLTAHRFFVATPAPAGAEAVVNTDRSSDKQLNGGRIVACDTKGNFVVVWDSLGQDGSGLGVYGQRFNRGGQKVGSEFLINTTTAGDQSFAAAAMDADGDFVVVWQSVNGGQTNLLAQRFTAAGAPAGSEFQVNTASLQAPIFPAVAMDAAGGFVVAWTQADASGKGIVARRYGPSGAALGAEFPVNTTTASDQIRPAVAMDADGDFVIAWESFGQDGDDAGIFAQCFTGTGVPLGSEFQANLAAANAQSAPRAAMDADGDFVIGWTSNLQDGSGAGAFARRFNSAGTAQGVEVQANSATAGDQVLTSVAMESNGSYVVVWTNTGGAIQARRYGADGSPRGAAFDVNTLAGTVGSASAAMDADGDFVIAWQTDATGAFDDVVARVYLGNPSPTLVPPFAVSVLEEAADSVIDLTPLFNDNGGTAALTYSVQSNSIPALLSATVDNTANTATFDYAANAFGTGTVVIRATDTLGEFADFPINVTIAPINDAPAFTKGPDVSSQEDVAYSAAWATGLSKGPANESAQVLTFEITANDNAALFAAGPAVAGDGTLTFTPTANASGTATITLRVKDDGGTSSGGVDASATQMFVITITPFNDNPSAVNDTLSLNEDAAATAVDVLANDLIAPDTGETLTVISVTQGAKGSVAITGGGTGVTYTPAADANGADSFTYTISDGNSGSATGTVNVTITAVNDVPAFTKGPDVSVQEDTPYSAAWATGISKGPVNESAQSLTFEVTANTNTALFAAGPAVAADGALSFTPAANANGMATISLRVKDDGGTGFGGVDASAAQMFVITVTPFNDNPTALNDALTLNEDASATAVDVLVNDSVAPDTGETLTITSVTQGGKGAVGITGGGTGVTYTPAADANGADSFTYTISDGNGGTVTATVSVTITAVNDAPSFTKGPDVTVQEDAFYSAAWATGLSTGPANESAQVLTFEVTNVSSPGLFATGPTVASDGTLTFAPAANASGTSTITLRLKDSAGTTAGGVDTSAAQTFVITITPVNDNPTAVSDTLSINEDSSAATIDVLANDSAAPDAGEPLTLTDVTQGAKGAVAIAGTVVTYTPAPNLNGADSFTYSIADGNGGTATATVSVTIAAVNDAPTVSGIAATPSAPRAGESVSFSATAADIDTGTVLSYAWRFGDGGTSTDPAPSHVFAAAGDFSIELTVADGAGGSASTQLLLTVAAALGPKDSDNDGTPDASDTDDDNDGFSDEFETSLGTDPLNGSATPIGGGPATPGPLDIKKLGISLNFSAPGKDSLQLSGTLPVPAGFQIGGKRLVVDAGGVIRTFSLDSKGIAKTATESVKVAVKAKKGAVPAQAAAYSVKFSKGSFAAPLADEGLTAADVKSAPRTVTVTILLDSLYLKKDQPQSYSAGKGKGKSK